MRISNRFEIIVIHVITKTFDLMVVTHLCYMRGGGFKFLIIKCWMTVVMHICNNVRS